MVQAPKAKAKKTKRTVPLKKTKQWRWCSECTRQYKGVWFCRGAYGRRMMCRYCYGRWYKFGFPNDDRRWREKRQGPCRVCLATETSGNCWNRGVYKDHTLCGACYTRWHAAGWPRAAYPPRPSGPYRCCGDAESPDARAFSGQSWFKGHAGEYLCKSCFQRWDKVGRPDECPKARTGPCHVCGTSESTHGVWNRGLEERTTCCACRATTGGIARVAPTSIHGGLASRTVPCVAVLESFYGSH
jgi:hypothetical protein